MVALTWKTGSYPYLKMARIVAASLPTNEGRLEDRIVERTKWLGALAVILGKVDVLESMESRTLYESTLAQPVPDTTHIRGGHGMVGSHSSRFLELRLRGCESKEIHTICPALRVGASSQNGR